MSLQPAPWVGLVPTCEAVFSGYPHPGCAEFGPPDEWRCDQPARLLCETTDGGEDQYLVCVAHALADLDHCVILRALDGLDFASHVLGIVDAAMMDLESEPDLIDAAIFGGTGALQQDAAYLQGWHAIIVVRTAAYLAQWDQP